ncbi:MAG TPA: HdeD family acid-resistance protein [Gammaproteobacteria bacterium]|nr:HdeD family acid-resistance protein [Gammaproteobacteria bacterium]
MDRIEDRLAYILHRGWWLLLLRGVAAIAFGLLTWFQPGISLAALVLLFGAYSFADGVFSTWTALAGRAHNEYWWVLLLRGLLGIGIGILTFFEPGITALVLLFYIAIWAIATGMLEIAAAIRLRREIQGEWLLILSGAVSVVFGVVLVARPGAGALAVLWLIGSFAFVFGVLLVALALRARGFARSVARA